ncbi:MAG: DUF922 domain-containing protein [Chitinophagaceae bacterium]
MFKELFSFLSFIFICSSCWSQKVLVNVFMQDRATITTGDTIYHDLNKRLTWKDFKGIPDAKHFGGAVTASGYAFDADIKIKGKIVYLNIGVYVFFNKYQSWKKANINSDYHLLHEQVHFDITRLGAENFIKQLVNSKFTKENYEKLLNSVFDECYNENAAWQQQYDKETSHSINKTEQLKWNYKIATELKKLQ